MTTPASETSWRTLYFGCWGRVGHGFHDAEGRSLHPPTNDCGPWGYGIDSLNRHGAHIPQGTRYHAQKDGWTVLDVTDRTVDSRGGSHSAFVAPGLFTEDEMVTLACATFPHIAKRIGLSPAVANAQSKHPISLDQPSRETTCWREHRPGYVCMLDEGHPSEQLADNAQSCACGERKNEGQHAEAVCMVGSAVYLRPEDTHV